MHIIISSAYPLESQKGNSITAKRISSLLRSAGHQAQAICSHTPPACDALIALHAIKTLPSSRYFKAHNPSGKLLIYLTGTDLYRDLPANNPEFYEALELADHLIVSQVASLESIPSEYRAKSHVIPASVLLPNISPVSPPPRPSIALIGHLRAVKNSFLLNQALTLLPDLHVHAFSIGDALDSSMIETARNCEETDQRYQWLGDTPYAEALSWMQQVSYTLNTSHSEGGSNAIAESIVLGTPVLASRIEGNIGMLGSEYSGYFTPNDAASLAALIKRSVTDSEFAQKLKEQTLSLQRNFSPASETSSLMKLLLSYSLTLLSSLLYHCPTALKFAINLA